VSHLEFSVPTVELLVGQINSGVSGVHLRLLNLEDAHRDDYLVFRHGQHRSTTKHHLEGGDDVSARIYKKGMSRIVDKYTPEGDLNPWYDALPPITDLSSIASKRGNPKTIFDLSLPGWHTVLDFTNWGSPGRAKLEALVRTTSNTSSARHYWVGNSHNKGKAFPVGIDHIARPSGLYLSHTFLDAVIIRPSSPDPIVAVSNKWRLTAAVGHEGDGNMVRRFAFREVNNRG